MNILKLLINVCIVQLPTPAPSPSFTIVQHWVAGKSKAKDGSLLMTQSISGLSKAPSKLLFNKINAKTPL